MYKLAGENTASRRNAYNLGEPDRKWDCIGENMNVLFSNPKSAVFRLLHVMNQSRPISVLLLY